MAFKFLQHVNLIKADIIVHNTDLHDVTNLIFTYKVKMLKPISLTKPDVPKQNKIHHRSSFVMYDVS